MRTALAIVAFCFLVGADDASDDAKKDMKLLEGEWSLESGQDNGNQIPEFITKTTRQVLSGGETKISMNNQQAGAAKLKIDPTKKPKQITYTHTDGPNKGKVQVGIYELKGDDLKLCLAAPGVKERPKEFEATQGSGCRVTVWKRAKK